MLGGKMLRARPRPTTMTTMTTTMTATTLWIWMNKEKVIKAVGKASGESLGLLKNIWHGKLDKA